LSSFDIKKMMIKFTKIVTSFCSLIHEFCILQLEDIIKLVKVNWTFLQHLMHKAECCLSSFTFY